MRKVVISVEVETCLAVRELREVAFIAFGIEPMRRTTIRQVMPDGINHDCRGTIEQVQVNAIKPEPTGKRKARLNRKAAFAERSAYRARLAKFAKEDARLAAADRIKADIDKVWQAHQRKARRAKGAK